MTASPGNGDGDGDSHDDATLDRMRSMWRELPDEEPPTRGLAELMAAARINAEVLARPSWWRRISDLLRRPSVLALASLMLLIGGAVLVTHRGARDEMPAASTPSVGSATKEAPIEPMEKTLGPAGSPVVPLQTQSPSAPATHAPTRSFHKAAQTSTESTPRVQPVQPVGGAPAGLSVPDPAPAPGPTPPRAPPETVIESDGAPRGPREVLVGDLLEQCRAAATRGDCETAKLIAARIARRDAAYYRSNVPTDVTIAKCLPPPD